jgi:hypothetical protein
VRPLERLCCLGDRLGGSPLYGGQRDCDRCAQCRLHLEKVRRVMRPQVRFHRGQQARGFITGRLAHPAVEVRQLLLHVRMPWVLSARQGCVCQHNGVAHRRDPDQTEPTRTGFLRRHSEGFARHRVSQSCALLVPVGLDGFFHATVALLLCPLRSPHAPLETCQRQHEADETYPTGANLHAYQMSRQAQAMQESKTRDARKKCDDSGALIQVLVIRQPGLQGTAGHVQPRGGLALRETLGVQVAIPRTQLRAFDPIPSLMAFLMASWRRWNDCAHSDLLVPPFTLGWVMAKDDEVACWFQPCCGVGSGTVGGRHRDQVADAMTEAESRS